MPQMHSDAKLSFSGMNEWKRGVSEPLGEKVLVHVKTHSWYASKIDPWSPVTNEETDAQRRGVTCLEPHSKLAEQAWVSPNAWPVLQGGLLFGSCQTCSL